MAFASDLQLDRIPLTLTLKSHKTGTMKGFIRSRTERDAEGDVVYWEYKTIRYSSWDMEFVYIKIYND